MLRLGVGGSDEGVTPMIVLGDGPIGGGSYDSTSPSMGGQQASGFSRLAPQIRNPLLNVVNFYLPQDRKVLNQWVRYYNKFHPIVGNCIDLHAESIVSPFTLDGIDDSKVMNVYKEMCYDNLDLFVQAVQIIKEFYLIGECLEPGSMVLMADGTSKTIEKVMRGDVVLTHRGGMGLVTERLVNIEKKNLFSFRVDGLPDRLSCTGNHPVFGVKKSKVLSEASVSSWFTHATRDVQPRMLRDWVESKPLQFEFIRASELGVGDWLVTPILKGVVHDKGYSPHFAWLLGMLASDGCVEELNPDNIRAGFFGKDLETIEMVATKSRLVFGSGKIQRRGDGVFIVRVSTANGGRVLGAYVLGRGETKRFSKEVLLMEPALQVEVLKGYIMGDGWVEPDGSVRWGTTSRVLAEQILMLCFRCGLSATLTKELGGKTVSSSSFVAQKGYVSGKDFYTVKIGCVDSLILRDTYGKLTKAGRAGKKVRNLVIRDGYVLRQIREVGERNYAGAVYNLEVEGDNSYVAAGVAVHNCFPFCQWNETKGIFDQLVQIDPDLIHMHSHPFVHMKDAVTFEVEPSESLIEFANSTDPMDRKLQSYLDPAIISSVKNNQMLKLSSFNMTALLNKSSAYEDRGTSIILRVLKWLMYEDKLMEANFAVADGHVTPRWIFKLGDPSNKIPPRKKDLQEFRDNLMRGWYDHNTAIVSTYALQVEAIGSAGKILPLVEEYKWVEDRVLTGMFTHKAATTGLGPNYANSSVARIIMNGRYLNRRSLVEQWIIKKIFTPVAKAHGFYKPLGPGEKGKSIKDRELWIPTINWTNKLDLSDTQEFKDFLLRMREKLGVSAKTVYKYLGIDYAEEEENLRKEVGSVFDPVYQEYRKKHAETVFEKKEKKTVTPEEAAGAVGGEGGMPGIGGGAGGAAGGEEAPVEGEEGAGGAELPGAVPGAAAPAQPV